MQVAERKGRGIGPGGKVCFLLRAVGAPLQDGVPAAERKGPLWDAMRTLVGQGWKPDTVSYSTAFRLVFPTLCYPIKVGTLLGSCYAEVDGTGLEAGHRLLPHS